LEIVGAKQPPQKKIPNQREIHPHSRVAARTRSENYSLYVSDPFAPRSAFTQGPRAPSHSVDPSEDHGHSPPARTIHHKGLFSPTA
jgi:hypothetical protein